MTEYKALSADQAIQIVLEQQKAKLKEMPREDLEKMIITGLELHLDEMKAEPWKLSNFVSAVTEGRYGVERDVQPRQT